MQEWEYCAIVGVSRYDRNLNPGYPALWYFTASGVDIVEIAGQEEAADVARAVAELGAQGWEMVGCGNTSQFHHAIYFKRPTSTK